MTISKDFLRLVLPEQGVYYMAHRSYGYKTPMTQVARDFEDLINLLQEHIDQDLFFATASFRNNSGRKINNVLAKKAFCLDLDCGASKPYHNQDAALDAAVKMFLAVGLPSPRVVLSGNGVHIWWPLTAAIDPQTWQVYADGLKNLCEQRGLHADPVVTASPERLMRCPGSFNYKDPKRPKAVEEHKHFCNEPPVQLSQLDCLLQSAKPRGSSRISRVAPTILGDAAVAEVRDMLKYVDRVDDYERWLKVGMAIHTLGWEETGYKLWVEWSKQSTSFNEDHQRKTWESFASREAERDPENCTTIGSIHKWATDNGWTRAAPPIPEAAPDINLFVPIETAKAEKTAYDEYCKQIQALNWERTAKGLVKANSCQNAQLGLLKLGVLGRRNMFTGIEEFMLPGVGHWEPRGKYTVPSLRNDIIQITGADAGNRELGDALTILANTTHYHPIREYLCSHEWDGKERLDTWLPYYCGAEDTPLHRYYGAATLVAAVRRAMNDRHVAFPHMLVLMGPQNQGKSAIVRMLGRGDPPKGWFKCTDINWFDSKSVAETFQGCWFYEWAELDKHGKLEAERIKGVLSASADSVRFAYRPDQESVLRRTIIIGTMNPQAEGRFIKDQTGGRRYWPVLTQGRFRLDEFERDVNQLFAEAMHRDKDFDPYFNIPPSLVEAAEQSQRERTEAPRFYDQLQQVVGETALYKGNEVEWVSSLRIKDQYLGHDHSWNKDISISIAMQKLGWKGIQRRVDGHKNPVRGYIREMGAQ